MEKAVINRGQVSLVTGADGFIGSHLVEELLRQGKKVRALCYYNSIGSWGWLDQSQHRDNPNLEVILGDVRDEFLIAKATEQVDTIFHLAALIGIPFSYSAPELYIDTNIKGTLNVLKCALRHKTRRILVTSTSEVYGTAKFVPITEEHPFQGQSPYSASKIGADRLAESFFKSYDLPVTIVRPFNTYGPRQSSRAIIPTVIGQLLSGSKEITLGSLSPTRDLVFVKDTVTGFIKLADCDSAIGKEVNICTGKEISVQELAIKLINAISPGVKILTADERIRPEASEVNRLLGSSKLLEELTNWVPEYTLEQGLSETIDWFKVHSSDVSAKANRYNI